MRGLACVVACVHFYCVGGWVYVVEELYLRLHHHLCMFVLSAENVFDFQKCACESDVCACASTNSTLPDLEFRIHSKVVRCRFELRFKVACVWLEGKVEGKWV